MDHSRRARIRGRGPHGDTHQDVCQPPAVEALKQITGRRPPSGNSAPGTVLKRPRLYTPRSAEVASVVQPLARREGDMAKERNGRQNLVEGLNDDLAREYQAIIAYVVYSQMLKGAAYMAIAKELEVHAGQELTHALTIAKHIDYLGGTPIVTPKPVVVTESAEKMLRADLDNEAETIRQYRMRLMQCEQAAEYGIAEDIREILRQEQEHLIDLATALGIDAPVIRT
jgi:bacterioferritin